MILGMSLATTQEMTPATGPSMILIEGGMTAVLVAVSFCFPSLGSARSSLFSPVERAFSRLAHRPHLAVAAVGCAALLLRLALLPFFPIPLPALPDDFSFLLAANTFASGRLTNPTPALWTHFESINISMQPTYMSMFFPAFGLVLAAGKVLAGNPWFGMLAVTALMCAGICWMLQGWLPPTWALLGGVLAILRLGLFSYWINTYTGGGSIAALGGALALGALPRLMRTARIRYGVILAAGLIILANSRPYEGLLLAIPVAIALAHWILFGKRHTSPALLLRRAAIPLLLMIVAASWMSYYNYRNFGSPLTLPYTTNRATYAVAQHFIWEPVRPEPVYRHKAMRDYYLAEELPEFERFHTVSGFVPQTLVKGAAVLFFFAGIALLPPLVMLRRVAVDRRIRFLVLSMIPLTIGVVLEAGARPYYMAPFTAAFYAIGLQAMRHLSQYRLGTHPAARPVGRAMTRLLVTLCIALAAFTAIAHPLHVKLAAPLSPSFLWACECLDPPQPGVQRLQVQQALGRLPGQQLAIVRYAANHRSTSEWVYNDPDIDGSKVIWAREMDAASNQELIDHYKNRNVWLIQPDQPVQEPVRPGQQPSSISPYSLAKPSAQISSP